MKKDRKVSETSVFYLMKCIYTNECYFVGKIIASDENEELYKGIACFMIIGHSSDPLPF